MRVLCRRTNKEYTKYCLAYSLFQSTSSVWRTTSAVGFHAFPPVYFNPRPPCGGRLLRLIHPELYDEFQSTSSVWRTTSRQRCSPSFPMDFNPRPPCGGRPNSSMSFAASTSFQSTSSVWRTTAKTEKNLYLHSYNTAICTDSQPKYSAYAFVYTDRDKQSPEKLVRSIRVRSARFTFARPMPPGEALRKSARHPDGRRGELRCVQPCFGNGCPAGKSAGCPLPGRSIWPVRP